jgi:hypothetical protein
MKTCNTCNQTRELALFTFRKDQQVYRNRCKICQRIYEKEHRDRAEYRKAYYIKNMDKFKKTANKRYADKKEHIKTINGIYRINNKTKVNKRQLEYINKRNKVDLNFRLRGNLRARLRCAVKNGRGGSAVRDLGCSIEFLRQYLESKFQAGMSWDNYGDWHIDHIQPLARFDLTNREQLLKACHYTNLQPLWAIENLSKGAKLG